MTGLRGRLFSLAGVFPLGVFLVEHLVLVTAALGGAKTFARAARALLAPGVLAVELALVWIPLAYHGLYGLWLVLRRRPFREPCPYPGAVRAVVRWTGVVVFVYLAVHVYELRFATTVHASRGELLYSRLAEHLSTTTWGIPWRALFALVGLAATIAHFAAGLWGYLVGTRGAPARAWGRGLAAAGAVLFVLGTSAVVSFATGGHPFYTPTERGPNAGLPCPAPSP